MDNENRLAEVKKRINGMVRLCRETVGELPDYPEWLPLLPDERIDFETFERRAADWGILATDFWRMTPREIQIAIEGKDRRDRRLAAAIARRLQPADQADDVSDAKAKPKTKRGKIGGKIQLSVEEKRAAVKEWDAIDPDANPIRLDDWLEQKFGSEGGVLKVAPSTLHGWRRYLEDDEDS